MGYKIKLNNDFEVNVVPDNDPLKNKDFHNEIS